MVYRVPGQSALHRETVSKNQNQKTQTKPKEKKKKQKNKIVFLGYYQGTHKVQLSNEITNVFLSLAIAVTLKLKLLLTKT